MCTTRLGIAGSRTDSRRYVGLWVGMILKFILALIFHTLVIVAASAEVARKPTLSGTVTDAVSGQPLVGAVLSCGIIIVAELLDDKLQDADELAREYNIPVLTVVPDLLSRKVEKYYSYYDGHSRQESNAR